MALCAMVLAGSGTWAGPVPGSVAALNEVRAAVGVSSMVISEPLQRMADDHAADMARRGYFSHVGADGSDIATRARRVGYGYCALAENIAKGQRSLAQVMKSWRGSSGHLRNMQKRDVTEFGLSRAGDVWVMVLGRAGC